MTNVEYYRVKMEFMGDTYTASELARILQDPAFIARMHRAGLSDQLKKMEQTLEALAEVRGSISETADKATAARKRFDKIAARLTELLYMPENQRTPFDKFEIQELSKQHLNAYRNLQQYILPGLNGGRRASTRNHKRKASKNSKKSRRNRK